MDDAVGIAKPPMRYCPHCAGKLDDAQVIEWGGWQLDENSNILQPGNVHFAPMEGKMLGAIIRRRGKLTSKGDLYSAVCANRPDADWPEMKIVDVKICQIRVKLAEAGLIMIETVWGMGYHGIEYDPEKKPKQKEPRPINSDPPRYVLCACGHAAKTHQLSPRNAPGNRRTHCRYCTCRKFKYKSAPE